MSTIPSKKSKSNKTKSNESKQPPRSAIAKIKALVEAQRKAEEEASRALKELEDENKLEEERIFQENEKKRLIKENKSTNHNTNHKTNYKKDEDRRLLELRLQKYGIDPHTKKFVISNKNEPNKNEPSKNTNEPIKLDDDWEDYDLIDHTSGTISGTISDTTSGTISDPSLRSPIICVFGHVNVGKTKLLDYLRQTHVQNKEAGGITQQIGSSFFPISRIIETVSKVESKKKIEFGIPGLLIIDTPGHESFENLRSIGSGICDFAILIVDILAGLERQTIESLKLLKISKIPFVIVLNKLDLVYEWNSSNGGSCGKNYKKQSKDVQKSLTTYTNNILVQMAEQGLNARLYWENKDPKGTISMIPTSANTGEGIPDLLMVITQMVEKYLSKKVSYNQEFKATVLEVKPVSGLGTTIDIILINGTIKKGDRIVLCGINGPIFTTVRELLTTQPMKELRIKSSYIHHESIHAAQGVKILAHDLDQVIAGSSLYLGNTNDEENKAKESITIDFENIKNNIKIDDKGVYVQASTLGGLEALLHFLRNSDVPVMGFSIGPVTKSDVIKASVMHTRGDTKYSVILAFDVLISDDIRREATQSHVRIFEADVIYHLLDMFTEYMEKINESNQETADQDAVIPCILEILPNYIFNNRNPIIIGVLVKEGELKIGTPLCVLGKKPSDTLELGIVTKIELNHRSIDAAKEGEEASISIVGPNNYCYGRQFDHTQKMYSKLSRKSIDALKEFFSDTLTPDRIRLIVKIKKKLGI